MADTSSSAPTQRWGTRVGVILAVTGSAVGLGNFLRFPGQAAQYGGGAFLVPYIIAFVIVGMPLAWAEWSLGRFGGSKGHNSAPGIFRSITKNRGMSFVGVLGTIMPVMIYMYYVFVEAWCLAYAWDFATGAMADLGTDQIGAHFEALTGAEKDGAVFFTGASRMLIFLTICFVLNFILIYRGITKGIEKFCNIAMPLLIVCALIVLVRVLTLGTPDPTQPHQNLTNGLGYMWNPVQEADQLAPGDEHLMAANQSAGKLMLLADDKVLAALTKAKAFTFDSAEYKAAAEAIKALDEARKTATEQAKKAGVDPKLPEIPKVATPVGDGIYFDQLKLESPAAYRFGLLNAKWAQDDDGRWSHNKSRLDLAIEGDTVAITTPGFVATLMQPELWLAATGQIFFSLSVGFGLILTYSSYLKPDDDVALSSLTSAAGNGFCEVVLGGMIAIPAAFVFLGFSGVANPPGTFGMGFVTLPNVFNLMPLGQFFGFLFFFLLFLAAVTSSLSMLQPAIALLEDGLGIGRKASVAILGFITLMGCMFIVYFSKGFTALDTVDFWMANFFIFIMATVQVIIFGWVIGIKEGMSELKRGAEIKLPPGLPIVLKYIAPAYLLSVFGFWCYLELPGRIQGIVTMPEEGPPVIMLSMGLILITAVFFVLITAISNGRWDKQEAEHQEVSP